MSDLKKLLARLRDLVFLLAGVVLLLVAPWLKSKGYLIAESATLNLGLVFIAVVVVGQMWRLCGGEPLVQEIAQLKHEVDRLSRSAGAIENFEIIGLRSTYASLSNYGLQSDWDSLLEDAESRVDLMGRTLYGWSGSAKVKELVVGKIKNDGVRFRWLIMSRKNKYLAMIEKDDFGSLLTQKLEVMEELLANIREEIPDTLRENFQVKVFSGTPLSCSLLRVDDRVFVVQYLFSTSSWNSPFYCLQGSKAAWPRVFRREFEAVWETAQDLFPSPEDEDDPPVLDSASGATVG